MDPDIIARIQAGVASMKKEEPDLRQVLERLNAIHDYLVRIEDRQMTLDAMLRERFVTERFPLQRVEPPPPAGIDMERQLQEYYLQLDRSRSHLQALDAKQQGKDRATAVAFAAAGWPVGHAQ